MRLPPCLGLLLALFPSTALALQVRTDHPRIMISDGTRPGTTLQQLKDRCTTDAAYQQKCQAGLNSPNDGTWPVTNFAGAYLVTGDAAKCAAAFQAAIDASKDTPGQPDAHSFVSNNGRNMAQLAIARDWCDAALDASQKTALEDRIVLWADWYAANPTGEIWHDDTPNIWNAVALAGLALKGTSQDAKADAYLQAADDQWKKVILPAMAYQHDWWHEGFVYVQPSLGSLAWYALSWTTATDDDIFAWARTNASDLFEGYLAFHAYAWRPDNKYVYFGDTSDPKQSIELFSRWLIDAMTTGSGSKLGQGLSLENKAKSQPWYDYAGANGHLIALWYDATKDAQATPRSALPTARWLSQGAADIAILRSGWGDDDTLVYVACGDYFGAHQRMESGSFQIFRRAQLTGSTGYYDAFDSDHWLNYYSQHSVHANTLAIYQPGEFFPTLQSLGDKSKNVNDGGQRVLRRDHNGTAYPNPDLAAYLKNKTSGTMYETGNLTAFDPASCSAGGQAVVDYVACDVTAAYDSPGFTTNGNAAKVKEVTRQFAFVHPDRLVVFDRIESTDPSYDKRFLLHVNGTQQTSGSTVTITNGNGKLTGSTLLPASVDTSVVANFQVESVPHPPSSAGLESGGTRLEISPKQEAARDYFLHVFQATDAAATPAATPTVQEDATSATVTLPDLGVTLRFSKTGAMGAHVVYTQSGQTLCDKDMATETPPDAGGAGGSSGAAGAGGSANAGAGHGGSSLDAGADAAGASMGAAPDASDEGGCGCRVAGRDANDLAFGAGALGLIGLLIRRRRRG